MFVAAAAISVVRRISIVGSLSGSQQHRLLRLGYDISPVSSVHTFRKMTSLSLHDPNSFSKPEEAVVQHLSWDVAVDFDSKTLKGFAEYEVLKKHPQAEFLTLDSAKSLTITEARCTKTNEMLEVDRSRSAEIFGVCTRIRLPKGEKSTIRITYQTSPDAQSLQWLTKEQTAGKKLPYVYSHCEAIHARSMLPCQDSPNVKVPFTAKIRVPKEMTAVVSGLRKGEQQDTPTTKVVSYEQKIPIPIYLLAFAVGDLESRKIGPRSRVWSEKEYVDKAVIDFEDTEKMIQAAEKIMGPYIWGDYDLVVLPPSFPFGGMENPCLTFMTPTVLAGDKSLSNVVAHEIAHSWTGNLVTNKTWEHFWLNEGFTVFVERKILGELLGKDFRQYAAVEGLRDLENTIKIHAENDPLMKLVVDLKGVDPDDSFSTVPYEKGHTFLYYLETIVGEEGMNAFLKAYVERFKYKSLITDDFKDFLFEFFPSQKEAFTKVDWNTWLFKPGMPPVIPEYKKDLFVSCTEFAQQWSRATDEQVEAFKKSDFDKFCPMQKQGFLSELLVLKPLSAKKFERLSAIYEMNKIMNSEIRFRWLELGIHCRSETIIEPVVQFLEVVGRMKFVSPLYRSLYRWPEKQKFARDLYERLKPTIMYVTRHAVERALELEG